MMGNIKIKKGRCKMVAEFKNKDDFEWYKKELDVKAKYAHEHHGEPEKYPCRIFESEWWDNPNGPYSYSHSFIYQQEIVCPTCGHKHLVWPKLEE